jgi:hypothetical protein
MPLNSLEDYERLGEHLAEIDGPLATFAGTHGYTVYPRLSGGRYPNRHICQEGAVYRSIQISMDESPSGERFDRFFPDIPYTVFGAAWIDDHSHLTRWHCPNIRISGVPFSLLVRTLQFHLAHFHSYLSSIDENHIKACALSTPLGPPPGEPKRRRG